MEQPRRVLVSGSSGLIGSALVPALRDQRFRVIRLVRNRAAADDSVLWNPDAGQLDASGLEGLDAVVHLAAENIAAHRWTGKEKLRILNSRAQGTRLLCEKMAALPVPPRVIVSASAMGYYGERGDDPLTENEPPGRGFLCDVVRAWEDATRPASESGIRVVMLRLSIVLSSAGGTLGKLLPLFRMGLGGPLAGGQQYFSWITIQDVIGTVLHSIATPDLSGPVNVSSPNPVRQTEFARILGRVLSRPAVFNVPRVALRLRLGKELADSVLWSDRIVPEKLLRSGYRFLYPDLEAGLRTLLGKPAS